MVTTAAEDFKQLFTSLIYPATFELLVQRAFFHGECSEKAIDTIKVALTCAMGLISYEEWRITACVFSAGIKGGSMTDPGQFTNGTVQRNRPITSAL